MSRSFASTPASPRRRGVRAATAVVLAALLVQAVLLSTTSSPAAAAVAQRLDLRVLVLDGDSTTIDALVGQMAAEGIPHTTVDLASPSRPTIDAAFLADGSHGFFQAIFVPSYLLTALSPAERAALADYEAAFGVRQVDGTDYPATAIGLLTPTVYGDLSTFSAAVTPAGLVNGFQYLDGPLPAATVGSYAYLGVPVSALPAGASFTTLVAGSRDANNGSLIGVHAAAGVERMVITMALSFGQPQFKYLAHGVLTWATRGVHLGLNRNRFSMQVDDAFASDSLWNTTLNCTPGEDPIATCVGTEETARMSPEDVTYAAQWQVANEYTFTLAFNGFYAAADDPLTQALVAARDEFRWLNHGYEHIDQGCVADVTIIPWVCTTSSGNIVWVSQTDISNEISANVTFGSANDLPFDPHEYLSGGHTGLVRLPQEPTDNPNFGPALTANAITAIGADASRETETRTVGSANTVPRHPTILYYNAATIEQEVDEYNFLYATSLTTADFLPTIIANDVTYNLSFVLGNDPRPFFSHTSNMTGDRMLYALVGALLSTYRDVFANNTPLLNLDLSDAALELRRQDAWADAGMVATPAVNAYVENGVVTVVNSGGASVPLTVPAGTTVAGVTLESYGGELSAWLAPAASTVATPPAVPAVTTGGSAAFVIGTPGSLTIAAAGAPAASVWLTGSLPAGVQFARDGLGNATVSGTASVAGEYAVTVTARNGFGSTELAVTLHVGTVPQITSASSTSAVAGDAIPFTVTSTGTPTPALSITAGTLPAGLGFTDAGNGTASFTGTSGAPGTYPLTITATNTIAATPQSFTLTIEGSAPVFTSADSVNPLAGSSFSFPVSATGLPLPTLSVSGTLPAGVTFTPGDAGHATLAGSAKKPGTYPLAITAQNAVTSTQQPFTLVVRPDPRGEFTAVTPTRVLDTRTTIGGHKAPLVAGSPFAVKVAGTSRVPATGVAAVVLSVTAVTPSARGMVTLWPTGARMPATPSLFFEAGRTTSNLATVALGAGGKVSVANLIGSTHMIVAVVGYYSTSSGPLGSRFHGLSPVRLFSTTTGYGGVPRVPLGAGSVLRADVTGVRGVPATGVKAVVLNVTAASTVTGSAVTVYPATATRPLVANLTTVAGRNISTLVIVPVPASGLIAFHNSKGATNVTVEVLGWFDAAKATEAGRYVPVTSTRLLDTRSGSPVGAAKVRTVQVSGRAGVPATGARVAVVVVTEQSATLSGYVVAFPNNLCTAPTAATLVFTPGVRVGNAAVVRLSDKSGCAAAAGSFGIYNAAGSTHLTVDLFGYFTA